MDFSRRKSISSHGSSSSSRGKHHRRSKNNSSSSSSNYNCDDDDDIEQQPILYHPYNNNPEAYDDDSGNLSSHLSMSSPTTSGEVIVKIDGQDTKSKKNDQKDDNSNNMHDGLSAKDFSFRRGDNNNAGNAPTSKLVGKFLEQQRALAAETSLDMDTDVDELRQQQHQPQNVEPHREHSIRRQVLQGLPPLPRDAVSRQGLSRIQSEVQSPDSGNIYKNPPYMVNNMNNNSNTSGTNMDGSKEVRVSFQDNKNDTRRSSIYSNVEDDDSASSSGDGDDDEEGSGRSGHHHRKASHKKGGNNNSGEVTTDDNSKKMFNNCISINKTKSRLVDAPSSPLEQRSGMLPRSGPLNMKSGVIGKSSALDDDEDDPFFGDDMPDEFKKGKVSTIVILEWVSLFLLVGALICNLSIPVWRNKSLWHMKLWKWQVLVLVLICGRLVSGWGIQILVFLIERNFLLRKRVLYFVYGLKKAVQNVIWLGLVLITWHFLFDKKVEQEAKSEPLRVVTNLLVIGEVGAFLWLLKTLLVKVCASTFHVNAFFDRIQDSLFNQFVIETLSGPPLFEFLLEDERTMAEVENLQNAGINVPPDLRASVLSRAMTERNVQTNSGKMIGGPNAGVYKSSIGQSTKFSGPVPKKDEGITVDHLHKMNQKNVSAWNMKRLVKIVRHGFVTTLDEQIVDATRQDDEPSTQIRSEVEAKAAARKMFRNVARPRSKYIFLPDLMRFMREDEALRTLSLFEGASESERISKSALKNWVVNAFRERRAIALTLSDTKTAVNKLHHIANFIVSAIIILIGVLVLNIISSKSILFLSSQAVVLAFVFGNTCKNVFESIIFLFVIHPFDVGDRCEIDGVQMVVEEMNILTTIFLRYDNQKIIFPNYILLTKPIHNYYRSPDMGDGIEFSFHITTPADKIALIKQRITNYIDNKKEHWYPDPMIILKDMESMHMLKIAVWLQHRMNHQDMGERWSRRALLVEECVKIFKELDIEYRIYPVNVNISSMPAMGYPQIPSPNRTSPAAEVFHA